MDNLIKVQEKELVVLTESQDDRDFARIYQVIKENNDGTIDIKCISQKPKEDWRGQKTENVESLVGREFKNVTASRFVPFM